MAYFPTRLIGNSLVLTCILFSFSIIRMSFSLISFIFSCHLDCWYSCFVDWVKNNVSSPPLITFLKEFELLDDNLYKILVPVSFLILYGDFISYFSRFLLFFFISSCFFSCSFHGFVAIPSTASVLLIFVSSFHESVEFLINSMHICERFTLIFDDWISRDLNWVFFSDADCLAVSVESLRCGESVQD